MTCPECSAPAVSGIVCGSCDRKLGATYESRLRLTGGGIVLGIVSGGLTRSLEAGPWAFPVGVAAFAAWMLMRTEKLLRLERVATRTLGLGRSE